MDDNQMMTTPIPEDLQLSESITSVYLHNSSMLPSFTNNIKTTETPKIDTVNSITLLPFSKLTNQILDSDRKDSGANIRQSWNEDSMKILGDPGSMGLYLLSG